MKKEEKFESAYAAEKNEIKEKNEEIKIEQFDPYKNSISAQ